LTRKKKVRYAVVGCGWFAQVAVLPAFPNAENSTLAGIVSGDPTKRARLGERYGLEHTADYPEFERLLDDADVDAVYITLPNHLHREYTERAARAGRHVLCEKPLALTVEECRSMIETTEAAGVKLMTAYRLHFEAGNMDAVAHARDGLLGNLRFFNASYATTVQNEEDIRLDARKGGGTLYDIGIYCINAARYLFRAEPEEVFAFTASGREPRFSEVDEMAGALLRFPGSRLASFVSSFGAFSRDVYEIVGTRGSLRLEPGFGFAKDHRHSLVLDGTTKETTYERRDQVAPELIEFSRCILEDDQPEPSGREGMADVRVIEALYESARTGTKVGLPPFQVESYPEPEQALRRPLFEEPTLVHEKAPSDE
jgi:glucose-fructose oxidoreductase